MTGPQQPASARAVIWLASSPARAKRLAYVGVAFALLGLVESVGLVLALAWWLA